MEQLTRYVGVVQSAEKGLARRGFRWSRNQRARWQGHDGSRGPRQGQSIKGYKKWLKVEPEAARKAADIIIKNTYRTLMTRGMKGCYVYCTDRETHEYFRKAIGVRVEPHSRPDDEPSKALPRGA